MVLKWWDTAAIFIGLASTNAEIYGSSWEKTPLKRNSSKL